MGWGCDLSWRTFRARLRRMCIPMRFYGVVFKCQLDQWMAGTLRQPHPYWFFTRSTVTVRTKNLKSHFRSGRPPFLFTFPGLPFFPTPFSITMAGKSFPPPPYMRLVVFLNHRLLVRKCRYSETSQKRKEGEESLSWQSPGTSFAFTPDVHTLADNQRHRGKRESFLILSGESKAVF